MSQKRIVTVFLHLEAVPALGEARAAGRAEARARPVLLATGVTNEHGRSVGRREPRQQRSEPPGVRFAAVFDTLANRLQDAMGDLGRRSRLDEETVTRATREIRLALLEADVDFEVVKQFVGAVRERALGQDVLKGLEPGQQVVKIVHEELTELMGVGGLEARRSVARRR